MPIEEAHRAHLEDMRSLARDEDGREVLIGLSFEETEWYLDYMDDGRGDSLTGDERLAAGDRWAELETRHERARQEMLRAEREARRAGPKH